VQPSIATTSPPFNKPPRYFQFWLKFSPMVSESQRNRRKMLGLCGLRVLRNSGRIYPEDGLGGLVCRHFGRLDGV
jgi:hypothetical protein